MFIWHKVSFFFYYGSVYVYWTFNAEGVSGVSDLFQLLLQLGERVLTRFTNIIYNYKWIKNSFCFFLTKRITIIDNETWCKRNKALQELQSRNSNSVTWNHSGIDSEMRITWPVDSFYTEPIESLYFFNRCLTLLFVYLWIN